MWWSTPLFNKIQILAFDSIQRLKISIKANESDLNGCWTVPNSTTESEL